MVASMRTIYRSLLHLLLRNSHGSLFCFIFNATQFLTLKKKRCKFDGELYQICDGSSSLYFARARRYRYYLDGIDARLTDLFEQYVGDHVRIEPGDVVIDCGANIGEFTVCCQMMGAKCFSFEPDPVEYEALRKNAEGSRTYSMALWKSDQILTFRSQNDTGDSTVDLDSPSEECVRVQGLRLDGINEIRSEAKIKLLKLEAEGFEPEVLEGASALLARIEYIAADLGPERGSLNECSLPAVVNLLTSRKFEVIFYNPSRSVLLFRNVNLQRSRA